MGEDEAAGGDAVEAEPFIEAVGAGVFFFGVEDDLPDVVALEVVDGFGHEAGADAVARDAGVDGDADEVAGGGVDGVELVAGDAVVVFGDDEVGVGGGDFEEAGGVVAPELVEGEVFDGDDAGDVGGGEGADADLLVAFGGDGVVFFVVGAEEGDEVEVVGFEGVAEPVEVVVVAGVVEGVGATGAGTFAEEGQHEGEIVGEVGALAPLDAEAADPGTGGDEPVDEEEGAEGSLGDAGEAAGGGGEGADGGETREERG